MKSKSLTSDYTLFLGGKREVSWFEKNLTKCFGKVTQKSFSWLKVHMSSSLLAIVLLKTFSTSTFGIYSCQGMLTYSFGGFRSIDCLHWIVYCLVVSLCNNWELLYVLFVKFMMTLWSTFSLLVHLHLRCGTNVILGRVSSLHYTGML